MILNFYSTPKRFFELSIFIFPKKFNFRFIVSLSRCVIFFDIFKSFFFQDKNGIFKSLKSFFKVIAIGIRDKVKIDSFFNFKMFSIEKIYNLQEINPPMILKDKLQKVQTMEEVVKGKHGFKNKIVFLNYSKKYKLHTNGFYPFYL